MRIPSAILTLPLIMPLGSCIAAAAAGAAYGFNQHEDTEAPAVPPQPEATELDPRPNAAGAPPRGAVTGLDPDRTANPLSATPHLWRPGPTRQAWVLAVGVSQYGDSDVPALPFAANDAEHVLGWFQEPQGASLSRENVRILLDEQATRENFLAQIDWLRRSAMPEDCVFLYLSCHGAPEIAEDGSGVDAKYLLLYDSDPDSLFASTLTLDDITRKLDAVKATVQVVILEACYTGAVGAAVLERTPTADLVIRPRLIQEMGQRGGRVILSASSGRQLALSSAEIEGGLFTRNLLEAWGDGSEQLLSPVVFEEVWDKVRRGANRLGSTQEPARFGDRNAGIILKFK